MTSIANSYSKTMDQLDTFQGLPLQIIHEKRLFVTLLRSGGIPDAIYDSRKVAHIRTCHGDIEIYYDEELLMPLVRITTGAWYYTGHKETTIYDILSYFGCAHFIIKSAFDYRTNILVPHNDMLFDTVSTSHLLNLVASM